jgi:hypothetical protein
VLKTRAAEADLRSKLPDPPSVRAVILHHSKSAENSWVHGCQLFGGWSLYYIDYGMSTALRRRSCGRLQVTLTWRGLSPLPAKRSGGLTPP